MKLVSVISDVEEVFGEKLNTMQSCGSIKTMAISNVK